MSRNGLTLLEILIAAIILALVVTGLANIFIAGRRHILHSRSRITAGELEKLFIDPLQMHVRQDTWGNGNNALSIGDTFCDDNANPQNPACPQNPADRDIAPINYTANYTITDHPLTSNIRKVVTTVNWNEPQP